MSSPSTPTPVSPAPASQAPACDHCGQPRADGALECAVCGNVFAESRPRGVLLFQIFLFVVVLGIALYPYIKQSIPAIERTLEPSSYAQRLGDVQFRKHAWGKALKLYKKASATRGIHTYVFTKGYKRRRALMHYKMAICAMRLHRADDAATYAEISRTNVPRWMLPQELLAQLYAHKGDKAKFKAVVTRLKALFPKHKNTWLVIGNGYGRLRQHNEAILAYKAGLALRPKNPQLLTNMAWELMRHTKRTKASLATALKAATKAAKLAKANDFVARDTLARARWLNGERAAALRTQKAAIAMATSLLKSAKSAPRSIQYQSLSLALARMHRRLALMLRPKPRPTPPPAAKPTTQPLVKATTQPAQPASRPSTRPTTQRAFIPIPRMFQRPTPIPRDPRHKRSRQLVLPR